MNETPNTVHGRLLEATHISGYTMERACTELDWLLDEDRWKIVGNGFEDIKAFLGTIDLSEFRLAIDRRKKLAKRLQQIEAAQRDIAKALGVGLGTVNRDLSEAVPSGTDGNEKANKNKSKKAKNVPDGTLAISGIDAARTVQKQTEKAGKAQQRREERLDRIAEISKGNTELPTAVRYPIIYADPPWQYENAPLGASNRSIENHYPTMTLEEICALPVRDLATNDALLYLWATSPKMAECFRVIEAWGFEYRTDMVWDKEIIGVGYHARNQHETLLIAKRGSIPPPEAGTQPSSVYRERRSEHSVKPAFFYEMIEAFYPQLPKIELFCRLPRSGWAVWGNQA